MKASDTQTKWSHVSNKSNVSQENNIFVKIIRDNRDLFCEFVTAGSNDSLETDVLPDPLKNEKVQSILKKGSRNNNETFRILPNQSRLFERCIHDHFDNKTV